MFDLLELNGQQFPFWFTSYRPRHYVMQATGYLGKSRGFYVVGDLYWRQTMELKTANVKVQVDHTKGWQPLKQPRA